MGFYHSAEDALAVVAGIDRQINFEKLTHRHAPDPRRVRFLWHQPRSHLSHSRRTDPGRRLHPGRRGNRHGSTPIIAGKPHTACLKWPCSASELRPEETLMVGDRLDTDILGGQSAGCKTALVLQWVSHEPRQRRQPHPDFIADDLANPAWKYNNRCTNAMPLIYDLDRWRSDADPADLGRANLPRRADLAGLYHQLWKTPEQFTNLPARLRDQLADHLFDFPRLTPGAFQSSDGETSKRLFNLAMTGEPSKPS